MTMKGGNAGGGGVGCINFLYQVLGKRIVQLEFFFKSNVK